MLRKFKEMTEKWFGGYDYFRINFMIYSLMGFWSMDKRKIQHSKWKMRLYNLFNFYLCFLYLAVFSGMAYDFYLISSDIEKMSYNLSSSIFFIGASMHLMLISWNKIPLQESLFLMSRNFFMSSVGKTQRDCDIIKSGDLEVQKMSIFCYMLAAVGVVARVICHLVPSERMLVTPFPFFDPLETPYFEIIFVIETIALIHFMIVVVASEMVIYGVLISLRKQLEIMEKNIYEIGDIYRLEEPSADKEEGVEGLLISKSNHPDLIKHRLLLLEGHRSEYLQWRKEKTFTLIKNAIIHHQNIINMAKTMNALLQDNLFIQIFGGGVLMSMLCADVLWKSQNLSIKFIAQFIYAGGFMLGSTFLCYFGSKVENKFQDAANSLYAIPWDEMDTTNRKATALFLMGLEKPFILRGRLFPINLRTYVKLVKFIYNTVAFIQNSAKRTK